MKTVAILGGRGKAGSGLVSAARSLDFKVKLLLFTRNSPNYQDENIEIIYGDARNTEDLKKLIEGSDFLINAVGRKITSQPFYCEITKKILSLSEISKLTRYILISNAALRSPNEKRNLISGFMAFGMRLVFRNFMIDRQNELAELLNSRINWTILKLPILIRRKRNKSIKFSESEMPGYFIDPKNLASFIISEIDNAEFERKCLYISD